MSKNRHGKRITNQNQLERLAEIRRLKGKRKEPKKQSTNIDFLFWQIAQERKKRGAKNVALQS